MGALMEISAFEILAEGLDHPECVAWGQDDHVYAGGEAGQVYRVSLGGDVHQVGTTNGFLLGICLDGDGNIYGCDTVNRAIMRMSPSGQAQRYFAGAPDRPLVNPNYAVFDEAGNLYFSDSGHYHRDDGCLWVVHADGRGEVWRDDVRAFPNGVALSPDGLYLYAVVSTLPGVVRAPLGGGPVETVARLDHTVPDGVAFDRDGYVYVSCYTPDQLLRVSPQGQVELLAEDWERSVLAAPTNIAFCGPGLDLLVVANLGRWHLTKTTMPVPGVPCHYPHLSGP